MTITIDTITDAQIIALKYEAGCHADTEMVDICQRALDGDTEALAECVAVIRDYEAQL